MSQKARAHKVSKANPALPSQRPTPALWPKPSFLPSERAADFDALLQAFTRQINPQGMIEEMYVNDIVCIVWDMLRYRRSKPMIIQFAFPAAIKKVVEATMSNGMLDLSTSSRAEHLAAGWFG